MPADQLDSPDRRRLIVGLAGATALAGVGAAAGVLIGRLSRPDTPLDVIDRTRPINSDPIDPALIRYDEVDVIDPGLDAPSAVVFGDDHLFLADGASVHVVDMTGRSLEKLEFGQRVGAMHVNYPTTGLSVATAATVELFMPRGEDRKWGLPITGGHITSIICEDGNVFLADARHRAVLRCDVDGRLLNRIGEKDEARRSDGFVVPSPYFDMAMGTDGLLWVTNPGRHLLEAYTFDGDRETSWGMRGIEVPGFCGCCNPTAIAQLPDGRFVTAEKGIRRVKVYRHDGRFDGVVAAPDRFAPPLKGEAGRKREATLDLAVDGAARIFVLDRAGGVVRVFVPKQTSPLEAAS
jgi:hypothetical protein